LEHFTTTIALVGIVIVVASLLSGVLERSGLPLVAVFLGLGFVLGPTGLGLIEIGLASPVLQTLAMLALALVLFSDAVTLETSAIRGQKRLTWRMLGPGTLIPAVLIALAGWWLLGISPTAAALLGAALASTDPVILRSVLRSRALPARVRTALRVESGTNDVVLLPVVVIAMLLLRDGGVTSAEVVRSAIGLFLLGPALGALVGWVGIRMLASIREKVGVRRDYESMYALGLAFTAFAAAEAVGGSGFLAAFASGLIISTQDVELCDCFLEYGEATAEMLLLLTFVAFGTSSIWVGFSVISWNTVAFTVIALVTRTVVLYPMLAGIGLEERERRLIALFGPRGLSSLLFALLPVFGGVPGAEYLFTVVCLVVLTSVVVHGGGIAVFLRGTAGPLSTAVPTTGRKPAARDASVGDRQPASVGGAPVVASAGNGASVAAVLPERISLDELRTLSAKGEPVTIIDARSDRSYRSDDLQAAGAVRLPPDDVVRTATEIGLSHHGTLVVYCA
jgi:NhaP-type Na+/H+ or K+/H+ antiporter